MKQPVLDVPSLLKRYGLRPDKRLGQNFLIDPDALQSVLAAAELAPEDSVLEIGPGLGGLTRLLATHARRVIAVELDERLLLPLKDVLAAFDNVEIIQGDILALSPGYLLDPSGQETPSRPYLVVANIPYYITSALIRHLLESQAPPERLVLTVQSEVAARICAFPGEMSLLALSVQVYGSPSIAAQIPATAFYPAPNVDSAVIRVDRYTQPLIPSQQLAAFFRLAKAGFSQKRKTLRNALSGGMHWAPQQAEAILQAAEIDPRRRAETLSLDEWSALLEQAERLSPT